MSTSRATWRRPSRSSSSLQDPQQDCGVILVAVAGFRQPRAACLGEAEVEALLGDQVGILARQAEREARRELSRLERGPPALCLGCEHRRPEDLEGALAGEAEGFGEGQRFAERADHVDERAVGDELRGGARAARSDVEGLSESAEEVPALLEELLLAADEDRERAGFGLGQAP